MNQRTIRLAEAVIEGISREILATYYAEALSGAEAGGLLLGSDSSGQIDVQDFEPVLCEHRFGPSFDLSAEDAAGLEESREWFANPGNGCMGPVGAYISRAGGQFASSQEDEEFMRRFLPPGSVLLRLEPAEPEAMKYQLFLFSGSLWPAGKPGVLPASDLIVSLPAESPAASDEPDDIPKTTDFPHAPISGPVDAPVITRSGKARHLRATPFLSEQFVGPALASAEQSGRRSGDSKSAATSARVAPSPVTSLPGKTKPPSALSVSLLRASAEPSPKIDSTSKGPTLQTQSGVMAAGRPAKLGSPGRAPILRRRMFWGIAATSAILIGGTLGYYSYEPPAVRYTARANAKPAVVNPPSAGAERISSPVVATADEGGQPTSVYPSPDLELRAAIEEWRRAVASGDPDRIAECYAPKLEQYFNLRNATRADVRRSITDFFSSRGSIKDLHISDVSITAAGRGRAVATFRKRWQTIGPRPFSGEERERLTFAKSSGAWKIVREKELRVFWSRR